VAQGVCQADRLPLPAKHGSWLNVAECELSAWPSQWPGGRASAKLGCFKRVSGSGREDQRQQTRGRLAIKLTPPGRKLKRLTQGKSGWGPRRSWRPGSMQTASYPATGTSASFDIPFGGERLSTRRTHASSRDGRSDGNEGERIEQVGQDGRVSSGFFTKASGETKLPDDPVGSSSERAHGEDVWMISDRSRIRAIGKG